LFVLISFNFLADETSANENNAKKTKNPITSSTTQANKTSESENKKLEEHSHKNNSEKEDDSAKKQEKTEKKEKTLSQSGTNLTSNEKSRRKQVEIEMKKWERDQVNFILYV